MPPWSGRQILRAALLGANGVLGRLIAQELGDRGHTIVAAGRDPARVRVAVAPVGDAVVDVLAVDAEDARSMARLLADVEVSISAVGGDAAADQAPLQAAIRHGVHHVDTVAAPRAVRAAYEFDGAARQVGVCAVPAAGFASLPGDLLADVVANAVTRPRAIHVSYVLPDRRLRRSLSPGTRRDLAPLLVEPGLAYLDGQLGDEPLAEARRLAWFPRPLGPHHAVGIPGVEPLAVPRHVPGIRNVRTYLGVPGWQAELIQALGNAARWPRASERIIAWAMRGPGAGPGPATRAATRWACVAETEGEEGVARAWMNGRDVYAFAAMSVVVVAERLVAGRAASGVIPPALVDVPGDLLDELAARSEVRWSVRRPANQPQ